MNITLILKGSVNALPPILSLCKTLLDLQYQLTLICDAVTDGERQILTERGCKIVILKQAMHIPTKAGAAFRWMVFRKNAWRAIHENPADLYWIGSADTALALGKTVLNLRYILHVHELYDTIPRYREGLKIFMQHAVKVFVPEEVRAHIFRAWYQLKETPVVLPNKPYNHPRKRNMPISDAKAAEAFAKIPQNSKIIFYQGGVSERRDLKPIAKAIERLGNPWVLAVQCPIVDNAYYKDFFENYKFYHIPYVAAPKHLEITSHVHFGLVTYTHLQMNNEFCAPNKIWEYSGFGLPMIGNDAFGLLNTAGKYQAGVFPNLEHMSIDDIQKMLQDLLLHEEEYSRNATAFFDSVDNIQILSTTLKKLKG